MRYTPSHSIYSISFVLFVCISGSSRFGASHHLNLLYMNCSRIVIGFLWCQHYIILHVHSILKLALDITAFLVMSKKAWPRNPYVVAKIVMQETEYSGVDHCCHCHNCLMIISCGSSSQVLLAADCLSYCWWLTVILCCLYFCQGATLKNSLLLDSTQSSHRKITCLAITMMAFLAAGDTTQCSITLPSCPSLKMMRW